LLIERATQLDQLQLELDELRDELAGDLEDVEARADDLEQRAQNRRRVERGAQQGIYSCIFAPGRTNFRDTWGAPRSGGRSHKGTDVFAVMGEPVLAFTDGVIARHSNGGLGGISIYLQGNDGNLYYYTHLQRIDANGAVGRRVQGGELIAYNGDTGNARGGAPHVHFEIKPGGGASINPYPWLAAACF
ncbi:MAG: peptidoglycan DD-metalloendopeptidase family protein, partial [Nitriliruptor sp.]